MDRNKTSKAMKCHGYGTFVIKNINESKEIIQFNNIPGSMGSGSCRDGAVCLGPLAPCCTARAADTAVGQEYIFLKESTTPFS